VSERVGLHMKTQFIKPSLLGAVLMVCLLAVQTTSLRAVGMSIVTPGSGTTDVHMHHSYGAPPMLRIETRGPTEEEQHTESVQFQWGMIAAVLVVAWVISMPIGRWITGYMRRDGTYAGPPYTGWRHPAATIGYVVAACALVSAICAVVFQEMLPSAPVELFSAFCLLLVVLTVPITVIVMIVRRWRHRTRLVQRGFAIEASTPATLAAP
jgi:hypothetical protein